MKIMEIEKAYTFNKMAGESFYLYQIFYAILFNFFVLFVITETPQFILMDALQLTSSKKL